MANPFEVLEDFQKEFHKLSPRLGEFIFEKYGSYLGFLNFLNNNNIIKFDDARKKFTELGRHGKIPFAWPLVSFLAKDMNHPIEDIFSPDQFKYGNKLSAIDASEYSNLPPLVQRLAREKGGLLDMVALLMEEGHLPARKAKEWLPSLRSINKTRKVYNKQTNEIFPVVVALAKHFKMTEIELFPPEHYLHPVGPAEKSPRRAAKKAGKEITGEATEPAADEDFEETEDAEEKAPTKQQQNDKATKAQKKIKELAEMRLDILEDRFASLYKSLQTDLSARDFQKQIIDGTLAAKLNNGANTLATRVLHFLINLELHVRPNQRGAKGNGYIDTSFSSRISAVTPTAPSIANTSEQLSDSDMRNGMIQFMDSLRPKVKTPGAKPDEPKV